MLNRIPPQMPVGAYKTYSVRAPLETHWRPATCEEADCPNYLNGWKTILPADSDLVEVARHSGRQFTETRTEGGLVEFTFEAGQPCFQTSNHRLPNDRPQLYSVRGGDWRGNLGVIRRHTRGADWVDDFANHQDQLADRLKEG
jgi:hypothetical protein